MSTRGFIGMRLNGQTRLTYNHSDSYPSWLGSKTMKYVRDADVLADAEAYFQLPVVDENTDPTAEQMADLKQRGYVRSVSTGADWYSALRGTQGSIPDQIKSGYLALTSNTVLTEKDIFIEWGYLIDCDAKELVVYEGESNGPIVKGRYSFDLLKSEDFDADDAVAKLEPSDDDDL
jgi:hypothetical protein